MVELRILGELRVSGSDGPEAASLASRPKRLAVLAYLAAAQPGSVHRRDKLLALFWPELDSVRARAALNQTLYVLRSMLGADAITSEGAGDVGLSGSRLWCDAAAFQEAADAGRLEEALALYRGDLLDGFFIPDAPDFEQWLGVERQRLRRRAAEVAWVVAEAKAREGDTLEAVRFARRATELSPGEEAEARRLMTFLHGLGDRAAAMRAYEELAGRLAREYELEPSAETQSLAAAIRAEEQHPVAVRLDEVARAPRVSSGGSPVSKPTPTRSTWRIPSAVAAVAVAAFAVTLGPRGRSQDSVPTPLMEFTTEFPGQGPLLGHLQLTLSPDGAYLASRGNGEDGLQLFIRPMELGEVAIPIARTGGAEDPFFSPDGEWLGFVRGGSIFKTRPLNGSPILITTVASQVRRPRWVSDGTIVFQTVEGIWRVSSSGGEARLVAAPERGLGEWYRWPEVLPGGRDAVITRFDGSTFHLSALSLDDGAVRDLGVEGTYPIFLEPDRLVFLRPDGTIHVAPFDPTGVHITGSDHATGERAFVAMGGRADVALSRSGTLALVPSWPADNAFAIVDRGGHAEVESLRHGVGWPRISPEGHRIVTAVNDGRVYDIVSVSVDALDADFEQLTTDGVSLGPQWSPDGRIAFSRNAGGGMALYWMDADGGRLEPLLEERRPGQFVDDFTPDGTALVFERVDPAAYRDLWVLPLIGDREPWPYLATAADERGADLSPDGRWLAYTSDESGRDEVYVSSFPTQGDPVRISDSGGRAPRWGRADVNGTELFYVRDEEMIGVRLPNGEPLRVEERISLFTSAEYQAGLDAASYDVLADGRFVMTRRGTEAERVVVYVNWAQRIRQEVR